MVTSNDKLKRKTGRPKTGEGATKTEIIEAAVEADGSQKKVAEKLSISKQAAGKHLNKPDVKKAVMTARSKAIKAAGLTRIKAYKQMAKQMTAKEAGEVIVRGKSKPKMVENWKAQDAARKDFLKIVGDYVDDTPTDEGGKAIPFVVLLPPVRIEPKPNTDDVVDV